VSNGDLEDVLAAEVMAGPESGNPHINGEYLRNNPGWHAPTSEWKAGEIMKMLDRHNLLPKTVGEVGCGAGEVLRQLQLRMPPDCEFIGYDIAPQAIEMCKERENDRLHCELADVCAIETPPFDLMLILEVVDHVEDYFSFLRTLKSRSTYKLFHFSLDLSVQNALRKAHTQAGFVDLIDKWCVIAALGMSVDALWAMYEKVSDKLEAKIVAEKKVLEGRLAALTSSGNGHHTRKPERRTEALMR
jgi:SAM-dependent methyltransferase